MSADTYSIKVEELKKYYGELKAVDGISFAVKKGEIFGFLGPNGAGKTTTVRMLTGVFPPDAGQIYIDGLNLAEETLEAKMKMGVVPELAHAYIDLTARENILFMARMYGLRGKRVEQRTDELLQRFGLDGRKDDKVKQFSKGMTQRVIICMALINEPGILFLDEPTGGLDVKSSRLIKQEIQELNEKETTIFLTTHNINEASELCDRIAIMNRGRIAAIDSPDNLKKTIDKTRSVEVNFYGEPPELDSLKSVNAVKIQENKCILHTADPGEVVGELVDLCRESGRKLSDIRTVGPELEDVFVRLTGGDHGEN
ncbi:MAG: ABC transporter ATP-binding protein [Halanaerobiaceae bacterium]